MARSQHPTTTSLTDDLENAILKGREYQFERLLSECVRIQPGADWARHALYILILSHVKKVHPHTQKKIFKSLMSCPTPPTPGGSVNHVMAAVRAKSPLLTDLLATGFAWDPTSDADSIYLIKLLAQGDRVFVKAVAPGILEDKRHLDRLARVIFDLNRKTDLFLVGRHEEDIEAILAMPVVDTFQYIIAKRLLPDGPTQHHEAWWPITDRINRYPNWMGGVERMVKTGWINAQALRERAQTLLDSGDIQSLEPFEPFMVAVDQFSLDYQTAQAPGPNKRDLRL